MWSRARPLMSSMRPSVWLVLQDVALDAEWRDGRLAASTSARLVAEHLRIDPGTAAAGLRALRQHGLVELTQASGADGRFGLAVYTLHLPDGIEVCLPHTDPAYKVQSHTEKPHTVTTGTDSDLVWSCPWDGDLESPRRERSETAHPPTTITHEGAHPTAGLPPDFGPLQLPTDPSMKAEQPDAATMHEDGVATKQPLRRRRRTAALAPFEQGALDLGIDA